MNISHGSTDQMTDQAIKEQPCVSLCTVLFVTCLTQFNQMGLIISGSFYMVPEVWSGNMCSPDNPSRAVIRWLEKHVMGKGRISDAGRR